MTFTLLLLLACAGDPPAPPGTGGEVACAEGEVLDGDACVPEGCGVGSWGNLPVDDATVYVDASAADGGDGSEGAALTSVQAGTDLAGERGGGLVVVAAGTYLETVVLGDDHKGVELSGRCRELVTMDGSAGDDVPTIGIAGDRKRPDVAISGMTVMGGNSGGLVVQHARVSVSGSDFRGNTLLGVASVDAEVTLDAVGILDTTPDRRGNYGRGVDVENGGSLVATGCTVQGNAEVGVFAAAAGTSVDLTDTLVLDTLASPDGTGGWGVDVAEGASLTASGCTIQGNIDVGVLVADGGTRVDIEDTRILDTSASVAGTGGRGVGVQGGATFTATSCTIQGNTDIGVYAANAGTAVTLVDTQVLDTEPSPDGTMGLGVGVLDGAALTATGCIIQGNTHEGVNASGLGTAVALEDTQVRDTLPSPAGGVDGGIVAQEGGHLTATRCTIQGNANVAVGAEGAGTRVDLVDTDILDAAQNADGTGGGGMGVSDQATLTATGCRLQDNSGFGVLAVHAGTTVALQSTQILDTQLRADGTGAPGIGVLDGAALRATDCTVQGSHVVGVYAGDVGTTVDLVDTQVLDTSSGPEGEGGRGVDVATGAALTATGCTISRNVEAGVVAEGAGTTVDLVDTEITETTKGRIAAFAIGIVAQSGSLVRSSDSIISATDGPGALVTLGGQVAFDRVTLTGGKGAGVVLFDGTATLTASTISDTRPDEEWGGGFGVYATDSTGTPTLVLTDSTVGPSDYAAVWLDGPGTYDIERNQLSGSDGVDQNGYALNGNALFAERGVAAWDGSTGLLFSGNTVSGATQIGVLLDGASAVLDANTWSGNGVDIRQQACSGTASLTAADLRGVPSALVCPASNVLIAYDVVLMSLFLPAVPTAR